MIETLRRFYRSRIKPWMSSKPGPREPQLPLGLSRDSLAQIQALTETNPYKHYLGALESLYENNLTAILRGLPQDAYMFQCGVCFALEQIAKLPTDLTLKQKELDARHTNATDSPTDASAIFTNSPFWDAYQRLGKRPPKFGGSGVPVSEQRNGS